MIDFTPDTGPDVRTRLAEPTTRAALFEAVLAASSDHIYLYDRKGRYLYASPSAAQALGLDADELVGRHWRELGFPEEVMEQFDRNREQVFETGRCVAGGVDFPSVDGVRRYDYAVCPIFDATGQVMAAACTASPAAGGEAPGSAALRIRLDEDAPLPVHLTAETQLQQVADALPVLVSYVDAGERYRFNNRAYEEWFGMPAGALRGRTVRDVVGEEAYAGLSPYITTALAGEGVSFTQEVPYAFGDRRLVHARYIPDCEPHGRVRGFFAVVADVRAPPAAPAAEQAAHAVPHRPLAPGLAALGGMTGEILHEITQPVTAIATYTEASIRLLKGTDAPPLGEILDWLEDMRGQARRASEIIQRFRAFVRGGQLRRTLIDVNAMITHCARAVRSDAAAAGVDLQLALARHPCRISADRVLLEQALRNLVTNALDALSASQAQQRILTIRTARDRGVVEVEVRDNGPGVPEDVRKRIFEPFFSTKPEGVGIGLAITRSIIEAHGGDLTLSPTPEGGATFRFRLPLVHRDVDDRERSE